MSERQTRPPGTSRPGSRPTGTAAKKTAAKATGRPSAKGTPPKRKPKSIVNQRQTPWGWIIGGTAIVVVLGLLIALGLGAFSSNKSSPSATVSAGGQILPTTPTGKTTVQKPVATVPNTTGVPGVIAYDTKGYPASGTADSGTLPHDHVAGPVTYSVTPPVGGNHNATWMNAGVYTKPIPSERAVHNLEHGAVWITYRPDLPASEVTQLVAFVTKQSLIDDGQAVGISGDENRYIDLSPWASNALPAPIVLSSWGYQLKVNSPTDSRMQQFVDTFRNSSKYTPEYGSGVDGIPVTIGGRAAEDGGTKPNPATASN